MNEEFLAAVESASPEMIVAAFDAAVEAAYRNHPRDGYAAALAVLAVDEESHEEAESGEAKE